MPAHQTYPNPAGGDSAVATSLPFSALTDGSNNQGQMLVSDGAALGLDAVNPGAISANYLWEIAVSGAEPLNTEALVYNASLDVWEPTLLYLSELSDVSIYGLVNGDVLAWNASLGVWQPVPQSAGGGGSVTSVFTRTGAVTALSGDYTVSQITGAAPLASPTFTGTVNLATLIASGNVTLSGELIDGTSSAGTSGQVLSSTGTKTQWVTPSGGGGGSSFPFTIVQEIILQGLSNATTHTFPFPQALAASGNTAFVFISCDGSSTVTLSSGWTIDINQAQANYARFILAHKTSAGDTGITVNSSTACNTIYFMEIVGSHALDQNNMSGVASTTLLPDYVVPGAITPTAGSVVYGVAAHLVNSPTSYQQSYNAGCSNPAFKAFSASPAIAGGRGLIVFAGTQAATHVSTTPPAIPVGNQLQQYNTGGVAYGSFSLL